jgi:ornithine carbamoyltransferase
VVCVAHAHTPQELAAHSPVPVLNALSDLWHPTQILADLLTLREHAGALVPTPPTDADGKKSKALPALPAGLTVAWLGDSTNVLHDMLVAYPRLGINVRVATPPGAAYQCPAPVWERVRALGCEAGIHWTTDPREAVHGADVVVTDTWSAPPSPHLTATERAAGSRWARRRRRHSGCATSRASR